jgi:hypothetical protein
MKDRLITCSNPDCLVKIYHRACIENISNIAPPPGSELEAVERDWKCPWCIQIDEAQEEEEEKQDSLPRSLTPIRDIISNIRSSSGLIKFPTEREEVEEEEEEQVEEEEDSISDDDEIKDIIGSCTDLLKVFITIESQKKEQVLKEIVIQEANEEKEEVVKVVEVINYYEKLESHSSSIEIPPLPPLKRTSMSILQGLLRAMDNLILLMEKENFRRPSDNRELSLCQKFRDILHIVKEEYKDRIKDLIQAEEEEAEAVCSVTIEKNRRPIEVVIRTLNEQISNARGFERPFNCICSICIDVLKEDCQAMITGSQFSSSAENSDLAEIYKSMAKAANSSNEMSEILTDLNLEDHETIMELQDEYSEAARQLVNSLSERIVMHGIDHEGWSVLIDLAPVRTSDQINIPGINNQFEFRKTTTTYTRLIDNGERIVKTLRDNRLHSEIKNWLDPVLATTFYKELLSKIHYIYRNTLLEKKERDSIFFQGDNATLSKKLKASGLGSETRLISTSEDVRDILKKGLAEVNQYFNETFQEIEEKTKVKAQVQEIQLLSHIERFVDDLCDFQLPPPSSIGCGGFFS